MGTLTDPDCDRLRHVMRTQTGLEFPAPRRPDLDAAAALAMQSLRITAVDDLLARLNDVVAGPAVLDLLVRQLTVGETHFFRNRPQFAALEQCILPGLIARQQTWKRLRLWSAGCASGEEAYSLAILVRRLLPDLSNWDVLILATDINREALRKATTGLYSDWSFREVPAGVQEAYFQRQGRQWEIAPAVRRMVTFRTLNLADRNAWADVQDMDLILCRNVLIYFEGSAMAAVVGRLHDSLSPEGWLLVGHSEPNQAVFQQFQTHNFPDTVAYQKPASPMNASPAPQCTPARMPRRESWPGLETGSSAPSRHSRAVASSGLKPENLPAADAAPAERAPVVARRDSPTPAPVRAGGQGVAATQRDLLRLLEAHASAGPQDHQAAFAVAKWYANQGQHVLADSWINLVLKQTPLSAPAHYLHGLILQADGRLEAALDALRRSVFADPEFVLGHFALSNLCLRLGQKTRAAKELDIVAQWAHGRAEHEVIPEGDGLTVSHLRDMMTSQAELICQIYEGENRS